MARVYGRHGSVRAHPGKREDLLAIFRDVSAAAMPGCRLYLVGLATDDPDAVVITEVWDSKDAHASSLTLESVRATIARARPLIAGVGKASEFEVVGGL